MAHEENHIKKSVYDHLLYNILQFIAPLFIVLFFLIYQ